MKNFPFKLKKDKEVIKMGSIAENFKVVVIFLLVGLGLWFGPEIFFPTGEEHTFLAHLSGGFIGTAVAAIVYP